MAVKRSIGWDDERSVGKHKKKFKTVNNKFKYYFLFFLSKVQKTFIQGIKEDPIKFLLTLAVPITSSYIVYRYITKNQ